MVAIFVFKGCKENFVCFSSSHPSKNPVVGYNRIHCRKCVIHNIAHGMVDVPITWFTGGNYRTKCFMNVQWMVFMLCFDSHRSLGLVDPAPLLSYPHLLAWLMLLVVVVKAVELAVSLQCSYALWKIRVSCY